MAKPFSTIPPPLSNPSIPVNPPAPGSVNQSYTVQYHTYPVFTADDGLSMEGAQQRFRSMPTPKDVFDRALIGMPKVFPLTGEEIEPSDTATYLQNAMTEIEMSLNINITPVEHSQSFDYIDGMFSSNFSGMKLERWPATFVESLTLKFPHTQTKSPYQMYTIPPAWVALRRNRINVVAAFGAIEVTTDQTNIATAGGLFSYITGFGRGPYQPAMIECVYTAGFEADKLPNTLHDVIVTLAALRFLEDVGIALFPVTSVGLAIDSVSQSATIVPNLVAQKIELLRNQYTQKVNALTRNFGRTLKMAFIGA